MIFRYVPLHLVEDYCRVGWLPTTALFGTHHSDYAVLMQWLCDCMPIPMPGSVA